MCIDTNLGWDDRPCRTQCWKDCWLRGNCRCRHQGSPEVSESSTKGIDKLLIGSEMFCNLVQCLTIGLYWRENLGCYWICRWKQLVGNGFAFLLYSSIPMACFSPFVSVFGIFIIGVFLSVAEEDHDTNMRRGCRHYSGRIFGGDACSVIYRVVSTQSVQRHCCPSTVHEEAQENWKLICWLSIAIVVSDVQKCCSVSCAFFAYLGCSASESYADFWFRNLDQNFRISFFWRLDLD